MDKTWMCHLCGFRVLGGGIGDRSQWAENDLCIDCANKQGLHEIVKGLERLEGGLCGCEWDDENNEWSVVHQLFHMNTHLSSIAESLRAITKVLQPSDHKKSAR